jgi:hypothetical protein
MLWPRCCFYSQQDFLNGHGETMRLLIVLIVSALMAPSALAAPVEAVHVPDMFASVGASRSWPSCDESLAPVRKTTLSASVQFAEQEPAQPLHAAAVEHSDAYQTRAKIHKYASFATLPLFAAEVALGQSLATGTESNGKKTAHAVVGTGIIGLFAVNTVTGAWNMFGEGRQDTEGRGLRLAHGLLMMAADVMFVVTTAAAPSSHREGTVTFNSDPTTHRNLAIASVSVGTVGYLIMLFGNH